MKIIRQKLEKGMIKMHKQRREALFRAVEGLLRGGKAWLSALGRSRPGKTSDKHGIKAIDRLLGNRGLWAELGYVYSALVTAVVKHCWNPVVLIDETEIRPKVYAVTASLAFDGRGIPIYSIVRSKKFATTRRCQRMFLKGLGAVLPEGVVPILVTDAGFESPWFDEVEKRGWDYVGRVRHQTKFSDGKQWFSCQQLHQRATNRARNVGHLAFPRQRPKTRRLVLSKARRSKGRKRLNTEGRSARTATDRRCEKSAREPWLLATSLTTQPYGVVNIYAYRMQIEENYRDAKNHRWGWALNQTRSRVFKRLDVILLIVAIASLAQQSVGVAAERRKLQGAFQANTERKRRVISLFVLGGFLLKTENQHLLTAHDIRAGFLVLSKGIRSPGPPAS